MRDVTSKVSAKETTLINNYNKSTKKENYLISTSLSFNCCKLEYDRLQYDQVIKEALYCKTKKFHFVFTRFYAIIMYRQIN